MMSPYGDADNAQSPRASIPTTTIIGNQCRTIERPALLHSLTISNMAPALCNICFWREKQLGWRNAFIFLLTVIALYLSANSLAVSASSHLVPLFSDEWEMAKLLTANPSSVQIIKNIFSMHGEHFIVPTKILIVLDYKFFSFTNLPLIVVYFLSAFVVGLLFASLVYTDRKVGFEWACLWMISAAAGVSLVQWENTLWGFQSQLLFVEIGALGSFLLAANAPKERHPSSIWWGAALCFCVGFCIFSMGNGIFIVPAIAIVLLTRRVHLGMIQAFVAASFVYAIAFLALRSPMPSVGDPALRTAGSLAEFFVALIGGPVAIDLGSAIWAGLTLVLVIVGLFAISIVVPVLRARPFDRGLFALFAFAGFLLAAAGAASWARTPLGVGAALAPRYAAPMLLLWMSIFAILIRLLLTLPARSKRSETASVAVLFAAIIMVGWTNMKPDLRSTIDAFSANVARTGYFILSGATDDPVLKAIYPWPETIRPALAVMRERRLNLFARRFGLPLPDAIDIETVSRLPAKADCAASAIDKVDHLSPNNWSVSGWVSDTKRSTPLWVASLDQTGRILGYTPPLAPRNDVTRAIGAETGFKGFAVPVHFSEASGAGSKDNLSLVAVFAGGQACRLTFAKPLL